MSSELSRTQLWMGFIEPYMTEFFIANAFIKEGITPSAVKIVKKFGATASETTYGFVNFKTEKETLEAFNKCNNKLILNSNPPAKFKLNHVLGPSTEYNVWVGDLTKDTDENKLFKIFAEKYSSLKSAKVITSSKHFRGYGFLTFGLESEYKHCMKNMNGMKINGNPIRLNASHRDELLNNTTAVKPQAASNEKSDAELFHNFMVYNKNYYPPIPEPLFTAHSIDIPPFSRFNTRNELGLIDHVSRMDYSALNSARSAQAQCLLDPLLNSSYSIPQEDYYETFAIVSTC